MTVKKGAVRFEQVQRFIYASKIFWGYGHLKRPSKKDIKLARLFEIRATVISSEGYDYENVSSVRHNLFLSTLKASNLSLLVIAILFNKVICN